MTRTANPLLYWAPAIMLSLLAHATLIMTIQLGTAPDPVSMTEEIRTQLDVASLNVPAQRAEAREAEGEPAESAEATGERLGVQAVPTSAARPVAAAGQQVAALAPAAPVTRPAAAQGTEVPTTTTAGARLSAAATAASRLTATAAGATPVAAAALPSAVAALSADLRSEALPTVQPTSQVLASAAAEAPVLAAAAVSAEAAAAATPAAVALAAIADVGPTAQAVRPPSLTMAAASVPAPRLAGAQAAGTEIAATTAAGARLTTVAAAGESLAAAEPAALPALAGVADATALVAKASSAPVMTARPPPALQMAAVSAPTMSLATGRVEGVQLASIQAPPAPVATVDTNDPGIAAPAAIAVPPVTELAPSATGDVAGTVAPTSTAEAAIVATAALAWSGGANTVLDEKSLEAIQSFMSPGDVTGSAAFAGSVRDGIGAALGQFPCSRLQAAFIPETGGLEIRGHVPSADLKPAVVGMLNNAVGESIPVGGSVLVLPQPQCQVLDSVEGLGLPQSRDQADDPTVVGEAAQVSIVQYEEGDAVGMSLQGAGFDAYIYIDYYDGDGNVIHLLPHERRHENWIAADAPFRIGFGDFGLRLTAAPPFGQDVAVILGTSTPLYEGALPLVERADVYLPWLHGRIDDLRSSDPEFRGEWVYIFVMTGPVGAFR